MLDKRPISLYRPARRARPRRPAGSRAGERGFTLVEVLIALMVTVVGLMGLLAMHTTTIKGNRDAGRAAEATAIAQQSIEVVRALTIDGPDPNSIAVKYAPLPFSDVPMSTVLGRAGVVFKPSLSVTELSSVSSDLIRIRVVVEWADGGDDPASVPAANKHKVVLELVRTRQEAL